MRSAEIRRVSRPGRLALAAVAATVVLAAVDGFAASLGPATAGLGAGDRLVGACGTGLALAYSATFYEGRDAVDSIDLSDVPAGCLGEHVAITFYDSSYAQVGSAVDATLPAEGTTEIISVTPSSNPIDASRIGGVSVAVS